MTMGRPRGMGPVYWQHRKINKCEEFHKATCDPEIDKCCAVVVCTYCIRLDVYGEDSILSTLTTEDGVTWSGVVGEVSVSMSLVRNVTCELQILINGELHETVPLCEPQYDGTTLLCTDLSYSTSFDTGYTSGTLTWYRYEKKKLPYVRDPQTNCVTWFCGDCECTCKTLCVAIFNPLGSSDPYSPVQYTYGTLEDLSYECDGPEWYGEATSDATYIVSVAMYRDPDTGQCMLVGYIDGEESVPAEVVACDDINVTLEFYSGLTMTVTCAVCGGCQEAPPTCCSCEDTYVGCMEPTTNDACVDFTKAGEVWTITDPGYTGQDWGTVSCSHWWSDTFALSMIGCEYANNVTTFNIFMVEEPSAFALSVGVEACDWVCEVYSNGVYQGYVLAYTRECLGTGADNRSVLDWIQFFGVPIPNTAAMVTLTMVRRLSPSTLCIPTGRTAP